MCWSWVKLCFASAGFCRSSLKFMLSTVAVAQWGEITLRGSKAHRTFSLPNWAPENIWIQQIPAGFMLYPILLQCSGFQALSTVWVLAVVIVIDGLIQSFSKEASQVKTKYCISAFIYMLIPKCFTESINAYKHKWLSECVSAHTHPVLTVAHQCGPSGHRKWEESVKSGSVCSWA